MTHFFVSALTSLASFTLAATPAPSTQEINFAGDKGTITFDAVGKPAAIKIHGEGGSAKGTMSLAGKKLSGQLVFPLDTLKTGIELRDTHMKEKYLDVPHYSEAKLTIKDLELPEAFAQGTESELKEFPFKGMLTLKGVEKEVTGSCDVKRKDGSMEVTAKFSLKLTDYKVDIPSYMGIVVAEDVKVSAISLVGTTKK